MPNEPRHSVPPARSIYTAERRSAPPPQGKEGFHRPESYSSRPTSAPRRVSPHPSSRPPCRSSRSFSLTDLLIRLHVPEKWHRAVRLALFDLGMIAVGLLIFAYFHHVRPQAYSTDDVIIVPRPSDTSTVAPEVSPSETPDPASDASETPEPTSEPIAWSEKFSEQFTDGKVKVTDTSYRSDSISVTINRYAQSDMAWYVADIYIADIENYLTAFAEGTYGKGYRDWPLNMAIQNNAIIAVTGDYYGAREKGVVIRNGAVYRTSTFKDVCILYYDGVMETMPAEDFNAEEAIARGAYQAFSFGPRLLDENGVALKEFNSEITGTNPRCAIGYFEPGHYCFVVVDGRQDGYSDGMEMSTLANVFQGLGCKAAYNLDGGQTAAMIFMGEFVNQPLNGGRQMSDIVYIGEVAK